MGVHDVRASHQSGLIQPDKVNRSETFLKVFFTSNSRAIWHDDAIATVADLRKSTAMESSPNAAPVTDSEDDTQTIPRTLNRRSVLLGAGVAAVAATAAACTPTPAPPPAPIPTPTSTTSVPPTTAAPTTTTLPPPAIQPGSVTGETAAQVLHVARRLSFGQTPALLAEIRAIGTTAWIDRQLAWQSIDDSVVDGILRSYPRSLMTATEITAGAEPWRTRQEMAAAMESLDIIVSASQPGEAPRIDALTKWANMEKPSFTMPFNVTGFPAISICTGFGAGGLPVSMQMAGKPFAEPLLFRAAHAYETAMPWRGRRPAMAE